MLDHLRILDAQETEGIDNSNGSNNNNQMTIASGSNLVVMEHDDEWSDGEEAT